VDIDLRGAGLRNASFISTSLKDVTYYEAEQARFKPLIDSAKPTGPLKDL
jgi:hypothetical protein